MTLDSIMPTGEVRNISNSEVSTFLSCKRQYNYAYMLELEPKDTSDPLARGSNFHLGMELYWLARLQGDNHERSVTAGEGAFLKPVEGSTVPVMMEAAFLWQRYMQHHNGFPEWRPLGAEVKHELPITPSINLGMRYDFYFQEITSGKCFILDYKLAYEFWSYEDHELNGQMPKYIGTLKANGLRVDGGILEEIRSRKLGPEKSRDPKNLYRRTRYFPSAAKMKSVMQQHVAASIQIERHRNLSPEERNLESIPVLNKHGACKFCNFKDLCIAELDGKKDLSVDIRMGYKQNAYLENYNEKKDGDFHVDF